MSFEEELEYTAAYYHCLDPVENLRIRVALQPVKNLYIPLPQFEVEPTSPDISSDPEENQFDVEEYTFKWQERIFSSSEIKKFSSEPDWKKKISEKYPSSHTDALNNLKNYPKKLFSYVDADDYCLKKGDLNIFAEGNGHYSYLNDKINGNRPVRPNLKNLKTIPKRKVVCYYPSEEFRRQSHVVSQNVQRMYIMVDLGPRNANSKKEEKHFEYVLCTLNYDYCNHVLEVRPSFSENQMKPYVIGIDSQDARNSFYYWLYNASPETPIDGHTKESQIISKVFDQQEQLHKLQGIEEFTLVEPKHLWVTLLVEIVSAEDFEYDHLYIQYFLKSESSWMCSSEDSLCGSTVTSCSNSYGVCHFSHSFEVDFLVDLKNIEELESSPPELFFEVISLDKYWRYRNEGYAYIAIPVRPGIFSYNLKCWRAKDKTIRSRLERFFIGGGPELEDVSYVGLSNSEKEGVMSRFGFETTPSGEINVKVSVLHQSVVSKDKKSELSVDRYAYRLDASSLLGSVNAVLEAFRKARERMILAKKGLQNST